MLWLESQSLRVTPSNILGLEAGSYEAYCLDQAVWYFGSQVQNDVEQAGQPKAKGSGKIESARRRTLDKYLKEPGASTKGQFADPAMLFKS